MAGQACVFLVEDEWSTRALIKRDLETEFEARYIIADYRTGKDAFNAYKKLEERESLKLVITDYRMPDMDGLRLTRKLRTSGYTNPIILNTSDSQDFIGKEEEIGVDEVLGKPCDRKRFLETVKKHLQS